MLKEAGTWPGLLGLVDLGKEFRCNWKLQGDLLRGYATNQAEGFDDLNQGSH